MTRFDTFEDILAWQEARSLTNAVYECTREGCFKRDFALRDQSRKAGISIMANIAEGFDRGGSKEFLQFLAIAKGSTGELESHLFVALDQGYIVPARFHELRSQAQHAKRLLGGLMGYLQRSQFRGWKYRPQ